MAGMGVDPHCAGGPRLLSNPKLKHRGNTVLRRLKNIALGADQFFWVLITLGNGSPDETLSAALWRMELQGKRAGSWFRPVVDALFWFDPDHCRTSYESEIERLQLHQHYRQARR